MKFEPLSPLFEKAKEELNTGGKEIHDITIPTN